MSMMQSFQMLLDAGADPENVRDLVQNHIAALKGLPSQTQEVRRMITHAEQFLTVMGGRYVYEAAERALKRLNKQVDLTPIEVMALVVFYNEELRKGAYNDHQG